jgi:hypothetical protein
VVCALGGQLPRYRNVVTASARSHVVVVHHVPLASRAN